MNIERVKVLSLQTGQVGLLRRSLFESPVFNVGQLVEVSDSQKPYHPDLWKPRTLDEWVDGHQDLGDVTVFAPNGDPVEDALLADLEASGVLDPDNVQDDPIFDSLISPPTSTEEEK